MARAEGQPADARVDDGAVIAQRVEAMLRDACLQLTAPTPGNIDVCRNQLEQAAEGLRRLQTLAPASHGKRRESLLSALRAIQVQNTGVAKLLESAAAFHGGWVNMAAVMTAGYTANGAPARPETRRRLILEV